MSAATVSTRQQILTADDPPEHDINFESIHEATRINFSLPNLMAWESLGYERGGMQYLRALDSELESLREVPLSQLSAIEPPDEFMRLWFEDTGVDQDDHIEMAGFVRSKPQV